MSREILMEAADIVSRTENVGKDFVLAHYTTEQILNKVREYRIQRETRMDAMRENW